MAVDIWSFRMAVDDADLTDFVVEAVDGEIGKVDRATYETGGEALIVDTGPLVFGRHVVLPFGTIERIDMDEQRIYVDRTKEDIENGPEYDPSGYAQQEFRIALAEYYARFYQ
jgi:hypothetical protein